MNENIDLTKILKDCPKGQALYSPIFGKVSFCEINYNREYEVHVLAINNDGHTKQQFFSKEGYFFVGYDAKCLLFPSEELLDWSKFTAPWYKKEKFDPNILQPFDRVLVRNYKTIKWRCEHFSYFNDGELSPYMASASYEFCIPYNDDTKHLIGTTEEAPEYYRYWEE